MKAILDEGVPRKIVPALQDRGCNVTSFPNEWKGLTNGRLLGRLEENGYGCLITCDKNMRWQQPLATRRLGVLVLPTQNLVVLKSLADTISRAVQTLKPGDYVQLRFPEYRQG